MKSLKPIGDRILVLPEPTETHQTSKAGIITANDNKQKQVVVGTVHTASKDMEPYFKKDTKIMYRSYGYDEVEIEGVKYHLVPEQDIIGIMQ